MPSPTTCANCRRALPALCRGAALTAEDSAQQTFVTCSHPFALNALRKMRGRLLISSCLCGCRRVRLEVTKLLSELAECAAGIKTLPMLQAFLDDPEIDVRRFALDHVPAVLKKHEDAAETTGILESIKQLVGLDMETPNALPLKTTLAKIVVELAAGLGKTVAKTHILPIIVSLLEEEAIEVRIAVVENLPELVRVVGGDALTEKVSLAVLAGDSSWRVRMSYISTVHLIAASLNAANDRAQFDSSILPACKEIVLKDGIASVRQVRKHANIRAAKCAAHAPPPPPSAATHCGCSLRTIHSARG